MLAAGLLSEAIAQARSLKRPAPLRAAICSAFEYIKIYDELVPTFRTALSEDQRRWLSRRPSPPAPSPQDKPGEARHRYQLIQRRDDLMVFDKATGRICLIKDAGSWLWIDPVKGSRTAGAFRD